MPCISLLLTEASCTIKDWVVSRTCRIQMEIHVEEACLRRATGATMTIILGGGPTRDGKIHNVRTIGFESRLLNFDWREGGMI